MEFPSKAPNIWLLPNTSDGRVWWCSKPVSPKKFYDHMCVLLKWFQPGQVSCWGRPRGEGARDMFSWATSSNQRRSPCPVDRSSSSTCSWTPFGSPVEPVKAVTTLADIWRRKHCHHLDWWRDLAQLGLSENPHQAAFFFVNDDGLVKHLGEDIDGAGNFVGHELHDSCAVSQQHVKVSLVLPLFWIWGDQSWPGSLSAAWHGWP